MPGLRSLSPHEIRHSPGGVRSRRVCLNVIVAKRRLPSIEVFRPFASRFERRPVSQLGIALCHGRNSGCISTLAEARSWRYLESAKRETHASIRKWGKPPASWSHAGVKVSVTLYTCIFQSSSFARTSIFSCSFLFSFLFYVWFLVFRGFFSVFFLCALTVSCCWNHVDK